MTKAKISATLLPLCLCMLPGLSVAIAADQDTLRIRILEQAAPETVEFFVAEGTLQIRDGETRRLLGTARTNDGVAVERSGNRVSALWRDGSVDEMSIRLSTADHSPISISTRTRGSASSTTVSYLGEIEVRGDAGHGRLLLINHVPLEDYVASVVASEYPFKEIEGVKAQAVVARTYALRSSGKFGPMYDHTDHVASQVYRGVDAESDVARRAAELTRGQILTYNGDPIEAVYSASCGGHSANNEDVWEGAALPYLRGRPDPYDVDSPHANWQTTVQRDALLDILSREFGAPVAGMLLTDRSSDGRVRTVRLLGNRPQNVQANNFRERLNNHFGTQFLKSTFFDAKIEGDDYVFEGKGFGHGVGMCQYGAKAQAEQGRDYREILAFYYPGTALETRGGALIAGNLDLEREPQTEREQRPAFPATLDEEPDEASLAEPETDVREPRPRPQQERPRPRSTTVRRVGW